MTDLSKLTVKELKDRLKAEGLSINGKKAELVERLEAHMGVEEAVEEGAEEGEASKVAEGEDREVQMSTMELAVMGGMSNEEFAALEEAEAKKKMRAEKFGTEYHPSEAYTSILKRKKMYERSKRFDIPLKMDPELMKEARKKRFDTIDVGAGKKVEGKAKHVTKVDANAE